MVWKAATFDIHYLIIENQSSTTYLKSDMKKNKDLNLNRHSDYLGLFSIYYRTQKFPPELKSHIFDLETCIFFYIRLYHSTTLSLSLRSGPSHPEIIRLERNESFILKTRLHSRFFCKPNLDHSINLESILGWAQTL